MTNEGRAKGRKTVIILLMLLIAAAHIINIESYLKGELYHFYFGYFSDLVIPFGFYFLLVLLEEQLPFLRHWQAKLAVAFLLPSFAETCQLFGLPVLGSTFDLLDYLMYALGTTLAVIIDLHVFSRVFSFWKREKIIP